MKCSTHSQKQLAEAVECVGLLQLLLLMLLMLLLMLQVADIAHAPADQVLLGEALAQRAAVADTCKR